MQALQALKRLHDNISTERRALLELQRAWFAIIQPHQLIRGELAAWPGSVYPMRMIKYLGASHDQLTPAGKNPPRGGPLGERIRLPPAYRQLLSGQPAKFAAAFAVHHDPRAACCAAPAYDCSQVHARVGEERPAGTSNSMHCSIWGRGAYCGPIDPPVAERNG